jgi:hypothetical protein
VDSAFKEFFWVSQKLARYGEPVNGTQGQEKEHRMMGPGIGRWSVGPVACGEHLSCGPVYGVCERGR